MKCSEARKLMVAHGLSEKQIGGLQAHARECGKCAAEIQSMLVALRLEAIPVHGPSQPLADAVMARVETMPAPGRLTVEQLLAPIAFAAVVLGLAATVPMLKRVFLETLTVQVPFNLSAAAVKGMLLQIIGAAQSCIARVPELGETMYGNTPVNLLTAGIAACGLMVLLYTARRKKETAIAGSQRNSA